jgi:tRNA U38,U39,U40 pseudouridine synthase TruA
MTAPGWSAGSGRRTGCRSGALETAVTISAGKNDDPRAGRTDAGVHALAQTAHLD